MTDRLRWQTESRGAKVTVHKADGSRGRRPSVTDGYTVFEGTVSDGGCHAQFGLGSIGSVSFTFPTLAEAKDWCQRHYEDNSTGRVPTTGADREPRLRWRYGEGQIDSPNDTHYFYFYQAYGETDGEGFSIVGSVLAQDDGVLIGGQRYRLEGHPRIGANEARAQISDWSASAGPINPSVDPMEFPEVLAFVEQWTSLSYCDATFRTLEEAKDWCEWINRLHTAASVPSEGPDQEARATSRWRTKAVRRLLYAGGGIVFLLILLASRWL